ncbi:uncharacterized protein LOC144350271 [Saccoglossus kowalevskii]
MEDAGQYTCKVTDNNNALSGYIITPPATLTVIDPPNDTYPRCIQSIMSNVHEGDQLLLTCASEISADDLDLEWIRASQRVDNQGTLLRDGMGHLVRTYTFRADGGDNNVIYSCIAKSSEFPTPKSCTPGPLRILFPPKVSISPPVYRAYLGNDVTIRCDAVGNPDVIEYIWIYEKINIEQLSERFLVSTDGQSLTIRDVTVDDHGANVTCQATNSIGSATKESSITILDMPTNDIRIGLLIAAIVLALLIIALFIYLIKECRKPRKRQLKPREIKMWVEGGTPPYYPSDADSTLSRRTAVQEPVDTEVDEVYPMEIRESTRYAESPDQVKFIEEIQTTYIGEVNPTMTGKESPVAATLMRTSAPVEVHHAADNYELPDTDTVHQMRTLRMGDQRHQHSPDGAESPTSPNTPQKQTDIDDQLIYVSLDFDNVSSKGTDSHKTYDSGVGMDTIGDVESNADSFKKDRNSSITRIRTKSEPTVYAEIRKEKSTKRKQKKQTGILY